MNKFKLTLGDQSGDGHSHVDDILFECNVSNKELWNAYVRATKALKISLTNSSAILSKACSDSIGKKHIDILTNAGITAEILGVVIDENEWVFDQESIAILFLELAKTQLPNLKYEIVQNDIECINDGKNIGYGIYSP